MRLLTEQAGQVAAAFVISSEAEADMDAFINLMYPVNGVTTYTEKSTITVQQHSTPLIIGTAILSVVFLVLSVVMFLCHRKATSMDADDNEIRRDLVDIEHEGQNVE